MASPIKKFIPRFVPSHPDWTFLDHGTPIDAGLTVPTSSQIISPRLETPRRYAGNGAKEDTIGDVRCFRAGTAGANVRRSSDAVGRHQLFEPSMPWRPEQRTSVRPETAMDPMALVGNAVAQACQRELQARYHMIDIHGENKRSNFNTGRGRRSIGYDLVPLVDARARLSRGPVPWGGVPQPKGPSPWGLTPVPTKMLTIYGPRQCLPSRSFMLPGDGNMAGRFDGPGSRVADF